MNIKKTLKIKDARDRGAYKDPLDELERVYDEGARQIIEALYNYVMQKGGEVVIPRYATLYFNEQDAKKSPLPKASYLTVAYNGNKGTHWLNDHTPSEIYDLVEHIF